MEITVTIRGGRDEDQRARRVYAGARRDYARDHMKTAITAGLLSGDGTLVIELRDEIGLAERAYLTAGQAIVTRFDFEGREIETHHGFRPHPEHPLICVRCGQERVRFEHLGYGCEL